MDSLVATLTIAFLLFAFGLIAQEIATGRSLSFDRSVLLALRDPADPSAPWGPAWFRETARDVTALGGIVVLTMTALAVAGCLTLARRAGLAALMLVAVFGVSRIYLGVHYPTDALGGWRVGAAWAIALWAERRAASVKQATPARRIG